MYKYCTPSPKVKSSGNVDCPRPSPTLDSINLKYFWWARLRHLTLPFPLYSTGHIDQPWYSAGRRGPVYWEARVIEDYLGGWISEETSDFIVVLTRFSKLKPFLETGPCFDLAWERRGHWLLFFCKLLFFLVAFVYFRILTFYRYWHLVFKCVSTVFSQSSLVS